MAHPCMQMMYAPDRQDFAMTLRDFDDAPFRPEGRPVAEPSCSSAGPDSAPSRDFWRRVLIPALMEIQNFARGDTSAPRLRRQATASATFRQSPRAQSILLSFISRFRKNAGSSVTRRALMRPADNTPPKCHQGFLPDAPSHSYLFPPEFPAGAS